jgi:AcrR family transcriptional regulator
LHSSVTGAGYGVRELSQSGAGERSHESRERVLQSAERLVALRGFARVRLSDVAQAAGVSIGSLQHRFETRERLLREAFLWSAEHRLRELGAAADPEGDPWERLAALLERALHPGDFKLRAAIWIEFCSVASRDEDIRVVLADVYEQWRTPLKAVIEDGVAAGLFDPTAPVDDVVDILVSQIDGLEVAGTVAASGTDLPRLRDLLLATARMVLRVERPV